MDLHTGSPFWFLTHGLRTVVPPLEQDVRCDAAVIGGGITGALVSRALADAGLDVVVLDRRDLGLGSTVASTALLQYDLDVPLHQLAARIGPKDAGRAFRAGVYAIDQLVEIGDEIGSPVRPVPSVYALFDEIKAPEFRAEYAARERAGLRVTWLEPDEAFARRGLTLHAAIESEKAAQMDPYDFTHRLWTRLIEKGVRVFDRTTVEDVQPDGDDRVRLATDRGATVRSRFVVHAVGYEAAEHMPTGSVQLQSTYAFISEPMTRPGEPFMLWEYNDPYLYARWVGDRLLVGGGDVPFENEAARDRLIGWKAEYLRKRIRSVLPGLDPEIGYAWAGTFATTPDGLGYIGSIPGREREMIALGFGGNGITMSMLASEILRDLISGRQHEYADLYRPERAGAGAAPAGAA